MSKKGKKLFKVKGIPTSGIESFNGLLNFISIATNKKYDEEIKQLEGIVAEAHSTDDEQADVDDNQNNDTEDSMEKKENVHSNGKTWFYQAPVMPYVPHTRKTMNLVKKADVATCVVLEINRKTRLDEISWMLLLQYFVEAGAIAVRRLRKEDSRHVAKAIGATRVSTFADTEGEETFDPSFLGHADEVVEERISDDETMLVKVTRNKSVVSVIPRGANDLTLDEVELCLHDALRIVKRSLKSNMGARNCTYYMRNGDCRYGKHCQFDHPEHVIDAQFYASTGWEDNALQLEKSSDDATLDDTSYSKKSSDHATLEDMSYSKKSSDHSTLDVTSSSSEVLPPNILRMLLPPQKVPPTTERKVMQVKKDSNWSSTWDDSDGCCSADSSDGPLCKQEQIVEIGERKSRRPRDVLPVPSGPAHVDQIRPETHVMSECSFYTKTGRCQFGSACEFRHPRDVCSSTVGASGHRSDVAYDNVTRPENAVQKQEEAMFHLSFSANVELALLQTVSSVIPRGANDLTLDEVEVCLQDALWIVTTSLDSNMMATAGVGAVESALSVYLEHRAATLGSRAQQLAIGEFAGSWSKMHDQVTLEGPSESSGMAKALLVERTSHPLCGPSILAAKCAQNWYAYRAREDWEHHGHQLGRRLGVLV